MSISGKLEAGHEVSLTTCATMQEYYASASRCISKRGVGKKVCPYRAQQGGLFLSGLAVLDPYIPSRLWTDEAA